MRYRLTLEEQSLKIDDLYVNTKYVNEECRKITERKELLIQEHETIINEIPQPTFIQEIMKGNKEIIISPKKLNLHVCQSSKYSSVHDRGV